MWLVIYMNILRTYFANDIISLRRLSNSSGSIRREIEVGPGLLETGWSSDLLFIIL